jgi:hypothetical protein
MADENDVIDGEVLEVSDEELREARAHGWADKDKWRGSPEEWVDAKTFLERSRNILPIVKAKNRELETRVSSMAEQLNATQEALRAANAAIEAIQDSQAEDVKEQVEAARRQLKQELTAAYRDGDHEGAAELTAKLAELGSTEDDDNSRPRRKKTDTDPDESRRPRIAPEVLMWFEENPDYKKPGRKLALATAITDEFRAKGDRRQGVEFLEAVAEEVEKTLNGGGTSSIGKVSPGNGGSNRQSSGGGGQKTYADLPAEAKKACERMAQRLVGPDRKFKDVAAWRKDYAQKYFEQE